jgi:two-component system LytT family sensor kinase
MKAGKDNFFYYIFLFKKINTPAQRVMVVCTHIVAWLLLFTLPAFFFHIEITNKVFLYRELVNKLFLIGFFYLNYFFLIPKFFLKGKRVAYVILLLFSISFLLGEHLLTEKIFMDAFRRPARLRLITDAAAGQHMPVLIHSDSAHFGFAEPPPFGRRERDLIVFVPNRIFFMVMINVLSSAIFLLLLGGFIHLAFFFLKSQDEKKSLENASLKAEINQLKSQVNPHFLFNTLNSIYSQIYHKSDNAEKSILKLSQILRYVIYDTTSEKIELEKDIHYLSNYIDLQRLRLSDKVQVDYVVKGELKGLTIAPLLLITFIENAFKHGISYTHPSVINIEIKVFDKTLTLLVRNPVIRENKFEQEGVGLKNAKRRLELIYPGDFLLDILYDRNFYVVNLKINLHRDQLPDY